MIQRGLGWGGKYIVSGPINERSGLGLFDQHVLNGAEVGRTKSKYAKGAKPACQRREGAIKRLILKERGLLLEIKENNG